MEKHFLSWQQRIAIWMRLGIRFLIGLVLVLFLGKYGNWILKLSMPFLLGWIIAVLLDPLVVWIQKHAGGSRKIISLLLIVGILSLAGGSLWLLAYYAGRELMDLITNWDILFGGIQTAMDSIDVMFAKLFSLIPAELTAMADAGITGVLDWMRNAIPTAVKGLGEKATDGVKAVPSFLVSLAFFFLGSYFILSDYPSLCRKAARGMSDSMRCGLSQVRSTALMACGGYLKAQLLLSFGVFCILLLGFLVTGQQYSLLLAFALALLDFVPLLGAGTVMIPWAIFAMFTRNYETAISVAVIWGIIAVYRRIAEPKIVGDQTGLSPILSLFSIYIGMKLGGVLGMILSPMAVLVFLNLCRGGLFRGLWGDLRAAAADIGMILSDRPKN